MPFTARFPEMVNVPASSAVVTVTPVFTVTLPNVIAAVGVIVDDALKIALLVAFSTRAAALTVKPPPKLIVSAANVVNVPPDFEYPPLKLIVPAAVVFWMVPPVCVKRPAKETPVPAPVIVRVPALQVKPDALVNETEPVDTLIV